MPLLERRTRADADITTVEVEEFFGDEFSGAVERNGLAALAAIEHLAPKPLALDVDGCVRSVGVDAGRIVVYEGAVPGALLVSLSADLFSDVAQLLQSFTALSVAKSIRVHGGDRDDLDSWDSIWLTLLDGWPAVDPDLRFHARDGAPLDLGRRFTPDDDPGDVAHFLREAGFVGLRGWLEPAAMQQIATDMRRALPTYTKGDGRSWWATLNDGSERCVRMQHFLEHSPTTRDMLTSDRWRQLRQALAGDEQLVQSPVEGNCIEALIKPLGVRRGISDIPWHRDCTLGRHPYRCSSTTVGVSVTAGGPEQGQLRVVAGSHRVCMPSSRAADRSYLPVIPLATEPGDLTVHLSCTLHEAQPPLAVERLVMYTGFGLPPRDADRPAAHDRLRELREQAHMLQSQAPSPVSAR
jgi:hypothetical protein